MSDIFKEVDEEVRHDEAVRLWEKYQGALIALAIIVVAATAGWRFYDYQRTQKAQEAGAKYQAALVLSREAKGPEANAALKGLAAADTPAGYRALASLRLAGETGRTDAAAGAKAFDALAADASLDPLLQAVAKLRAALLRLDTADAAELKSRLDPLAGPGEPFRHSAREMLGLAALKAGDIDAAGRWFDAIVIDADAPQPVRDRAEAMLGLVRSGKQQATK